MSCRRCCSALPPAAAAARARRPRSARQLVKALKDLTRSRKWPEALQLVRQARENGLRLNVVVCNACIGTCKSARCWDVATRLLEETRQSGTQPDCVSGNIALAAYGGETATWRGALAFFAACLGRALAADEVTCDTLLSVCQKAKDWQQALAVLSLMSELQLSYSERSLSVGLMACCAAGEEAWPVAVALLQDMQDLELELDAISGTAVASVLVEEAALWAEALQLLMRLVRRHVALDAVGLNVALRAAEVGGAWQLATGLLLEVCSWGLRLDSTGYGSVTGAAARASRWDVSLCLTDGAATLNLPNNMVALNAVLEACTSGSWGCGLAILQRLRARDLEPDEVVTKTALQTWMKWDGQQWRSILETFSKLNAVASENMLAPFLSYLLRSGAWRAATNHLAQGPAGMMLRSVVAAGLRKTGKWQAACRTLSAAATYSLEVDLTASGTELDALASGAQWELALRRQGGMAVGGLRGDGRSFAATARSSASCSRWRGVAQLLQRSQLCTLETSTILFNALVSGCQRVERWQSCLGTVQSMVSASCVPDRVSSLAELSATAQAGKWMTALALMMRRHTLSQGGTRAWQLGLMVAQLEAQELWEEALVFFAQARCSAERQDSVTYRAATSACAQAMRWTWAMDLMGTSQAASLQLDTPTCGVATSACAEEGGSWPAALHILQFVLHLSVQASVACVSPVASAAEASGVWPLALTLLGYIGARTLEVDNQIMNTVLRACEGVGHWASNVQLLRRRRCSEASTDKEPSMDAIGYSSTICALEQGGHWQSALDLFWFMQRSQQLQPLEVTYNAAINACEAGNRLDFIAALLRARSALA
eukprot:TRINITY_DN27570_c0_g1_i1.p1 TRINITY_DN27570_c0_g1~~TRINITY_DN27570_c0_g1_i1.p1  ORF type:complete len:832 (+),score=112.47 TRINITY_DN27570_c0_g1_i1:213-2708(+)